MGLVRDIMRMDLDPPPVEQPKRFRYRGELRYPLTNKFDRDVYIKISDDGRWCCLEASENEVVRCDDNLYVWTGKEWTDFHPGPCTDYDGPKPDNKRIFPTSQRILNSSDPFHKMIQEKTDILMERLGIGYEYDTAKAVEEAMRGYEKPPVLNWGTPNAIEQDGNRVLARYDLKYIGETDTNVHDNPKSWVV